MSKKVIRLPSNPVLEYRIGSWVACDDSRSGPGKSIRHARSKRLMACCGCVTWALFGGRLKIGKSDGKNRVQDEVVTNCCSIGMVC
jgi:hypothetical protein